MSVFEFRLFRNAQNRHINIQLIDTVDKKYRIQVFLTWIVLSLGKWAENCTSCHEFRQSISRLFRSRFQDERLDYTNRPSLPFHSLPGFFVVASIKSRGKGQHSNHEIKTSRLTSLAQLTISARADHTSTLTGLLLVALVARPRIPAWNRLINTRLLQIRNHVR